MGDSTMAMADEQAETLSADEQAESTLKTFKDLGLRDELVQACDVVGWKAPTKIQADVIPFAIDGRDVVGLAQTGSGKTGAFALPILHALLEKPRPFFACVLSPTRESAIRIAEQFESLGAGIGVKCTVLMDGTELLQTISLRKHPHIVVGTPGLFLDHLTNTEGFNLRTIKYLVLDEADSLFYSVFEEAIDEILKVISADRRTLLFSATMTDKVAKLQRACLSNPVMIEVSSKYPDVDTPKQQFRIVPANIKDCYVAYILSQMTNRSTSIVFTQTWQSAEFLSRYLVKLDVKTIQISHGMNQSRRLRALGRFKAGECNILICTDVGSRCLHIPLVDVVINHTVPTHLEDYIRRMDRIAPSGMAISLVSRHEIEWHLRIEQLIDMKMPVFPVEEAQVLAYSSQVSAAKRIAAMDLDDDNDGSDRCAALRQKKFCRLRPLCPINFKRKKSRVNNLCFTLDDLHL